jgi:hypothetical protein
VEKPTDVQKLKQDLKNIKTSLTFAQRKLTVLKAASVHLARGIQQLASPESRDLK